jgi:hypothetical protein
VHLKSPESTLGLCVVHPKAAGIDIGNEEHWAAVPRAWTGSSAPLWLLYFTGDLMALADWGERAGHQEFSGPQERHP